MTLTGKSSFSTNIKKLRGFKMEEKVNLRLTLEVKPDDFGKVIDSIKCNDVIRKRLNKSDIRNLAIIRLVPKIKSEFTEINEVFRQLRKAGYQYRFKRFKEEVMRLCCFELIEAVEKEGMTMIRNISDNSISIEVD